MTEMEVDKIEIKLSLTPSEVKTVMDLVMSMRGNPADDVRSSTYARTADIERTATALAQTPPPPPPPTMGNVPPPPPPPPAHAPAAAPSVPGQAATASSVPTDIRGVPFHIDHYSGTAEAPGRNDDGSWKKRRGHDKDALKAYEAPFLAGKSDAGQHAPQTDATTGNIAPPTHGAAPQMTAGTPGASHNPPPPPPVMAPPPGTPGIQDFELLWGRLVATGAAPPALEQWIIAEYGGHPVHSDVFKADPVKRLTAYQFLKRYEPQQQAA